MSTLVENVEKVKSAHDALSASIEAKGVSVPAGTKLTGMPALVDQIQTGGGSLTPNTSKVTFHADSSTHIDVNRIIVADTSQMTSFEGFFQDDIQLTSVSIPADFAPNATNMNGFFQSCLNMKTVNLPDNFAPNATSFESFLYNCSKLSSFEYSGDFGQKAENVKNFFRGCYAISSMVVPPNFANVIRCDDMFSQCTNLTSVTFPSNFGNRVQFYDWSDLNIFTQCNKLTEIYGDLSLSVTFTLRNSLISHDSLIRVLNSIQTLSQTRTINLGTDNLAKLTDAEKQIATDKGWTLA